MLLLFCRHGRKAWGCGAVGRSRNLEARRASTEYLVLKFLAPCCRTIEARFRGRHRNLARDDSCVRDESNLGMSNATCIFEVSLKLEVTPRGERCVAFENLKPLRYCSTVSKNMDAMDLGECFLHAEYRSLSLVGLSCPGNSFQHSPLKIHCKLIFSPLISLGHGEHLAVSTK